MSTPYSPTVDDIPELREMIRLCREMRKEATKNGNHRMEVEADAFTKSARRRYKAAISHLRCAH